ncbi:hypothetical protein D3C87_1363280 [compost metagenome]
MDDIVAHRHDRAIEPQHMQADVEARGGRKRVVVEADEIVGDEAVANALRLEAGGALGEHDVDGPVGLLGVGNFLEAHRAQGREAIALLPVMLAA